jgi:hypothetical protein
MNPSDWTEETWLNEGLSQVAEELMGYAVSDLSPRQNIDIEQITDSQSATQASGVRPRGGRRRNRAHRHLLHPGRQRTDASRPGLMGTMSCSKVPRRDNNLPRGGTIGGRWDGPHGQVDRHASASSICPPGKAAA